MCVGLPLEQQQLPEGLFAVSIVTGGEEYRRNEETNAHICGYNYLQVINLTQITS